MIRILLPCLVAALVAWAVPASAQSGGDIDAGVKACFAEADGPAASCIGQASNFCIERRDGGDTTTGMSACLAAEADAWDGLLGMVFDSLQAEFAQTDAAFDLLDSDARTEALAAAQAAWSSYRDAECRLEEAIYPGGTVGAIAAGRCRMELTARRALDLRALASPEGR